MISINSFFDNFKSIIIILGKSMQYYTYFILLTVLISSISCTSNNSLDPKEPSKKPFCWVVGQCDSTNFAPILFSEDGGVSWQRKGMKQIVLEGINLTDVWAVNENTIWAIGDKSSIFKSTDKGNTWKRINLGDIVSDINFMNIFVFDKSKIWVSGDKGTIVHSSDNGINWVNLCEDRFVDYAFQGVCAITKDVVYAVGGHQEHDDGFIIRTLDGGKSWEVINPAQNFNINRWIGAASNKNTILIYGSKSHYILSSDNGHSWKNDSIPSIGGGGGAPDINNLKLLDYQTWWCAMDLNTIAYTFDSGKSWTIQESGTSGCFMLGIDNLDGKTCVSVGSPFSMPIVSKIVHTTNKGLTWNETYSFNGFLSKVSFIRD